MSTHYKDDDHPDDSPTDELPVLSEMDVVEDFERTSVFVALEDTGRHATLRFRAPAEWDADDYDAAQDTASQQRPTGDALRRNGGNAHETEDSADTAARFASLPAAAALEARVAELTARASASDAALADRDATIASLEERLEATRRAVLRRDETEQQLRSTLAERELRIGQLEGRAADVAARLAEQEVELVSREASFTERDNALSQRESALALRESELIERDGAVVLRATDLSERQRRLEAREAELREREELSSRLATELGERASSLTLRDAELTERQAELARSDAALRQQEAEWSRRSMLIDEREDRLVECETALEELEAELATREQALLTRETVPTEIGTPDAEMDRAANGAGAGAPEAVAGLKSRIAELLELNEGLREQLDVLGATSPTANADADVDAAVDAVKEDEQAASPAGSPQASAASFSEVATSSSQNVEHEGRNLLAALRRSREEAAALADYIDGRRSHWNSMEATLAEQKIRIEELDRELEQRAGRQRQAESVAAAEMQRVADLKAEIARLRFLADGGHPERNRIRAHAAAASALAREASRLPEEWESASQVGPQRARLASADAPPEAGAAGAALEVPADVPASPMQPADLPVAPMKPADVPASSVQPVDVPASSVQPVDVPVSLALPLVSRPADMLPAPPGGATDVSADGDPAERILLDGDQEDSADMERRFNESEAQLERTRAALRRLERILIERDRAMDIKNARIDALQAELQDKLVAAPHVNEAPRPKRGTQRGEAPSAGAGPPPPTMICLTGEAPSSYPLHKRVVTIGRSAECDIQVATHFVSREHARLSVSPDGVFIEDLGSKNGVFVNAVRVEREGLRHGDLVTVGETQFRFVTD